MNLPAMTYAPGYLLPRPLAAEEVIAVLIVRAEKVDDSNMDERTYNAHHAKIDQLYRELWRLTGGNDTWALAWARLMDRHVHEAR